MKAMQEAERQAALQKQRAAEEAEAARRMQQLNLGGYQPPQSYQDLYKDPEFFAHAYRKYVDELEQDVSSSSQHTYGSGQAHSQMSKPSYEDRADSEGLTTEYSNFSQVNADDEAQQEMINITSCDFKEFSAYMVKNYGEQAFNDGFKTIKQY